MSERVPDGWMLKIVRDTSKLSAGGTPSTQVTEYWENGTIPWMSSGEVHKKRVHSVDNCITTLGLENSSAKMFPSKSILVALAGQGKTRGTVAISEIELTTNQSIAAIIVKDKSVYPDFLYHNLDSRYEELRGVSGGSGRAGLNLAILGDLDVLLPPLPEQQKIAKILTSVDEVIEKTQAQIDKLKDLKTGMMQELLTKGVGVDGKPHTEFKDSPVGRIPKTWECLTMRDICTTKQGLQIPISDRYKSSGPRRYQYLTIKFINSGFNEAIAEYIENPSSRVVCNPDDIILARTGATGKVVTGVHGVFHNNFFMVDYERDKVVKDFLVQYLRSHAVQEEIKNRAGTTTIPDLNHGDFYSLPVPIPSIQEQKDISDVLLSVDQSIVTKQTKLNAMLHMKKALMQDLLTGKVRVNID